MRWGVIGLLLCCLFAIPWPHHGLTFWMFAVGQGDAMSLQFPEGKRWVIDGGPNTVLLEKIGRQLPWYEWGLDTVVMTHADQDHITAFYELGERYDVTRWVIPDKATPMAQHIRDTGNGEVIQVRAGDDLSVGDVSIKVLGPEHLQKDRNANSVVLYLEYGEGNLLLTGDAGVEEENAWFKQLGTVDVLKAGHHGSHTSTSWELLQVTQPDIALISAGKENRHGHPHGIVVRRLEEIGAKILQTNKHGDIQMHFDGGEPRVGQTKNNPL